MFSNSPLPLPIMEAVPPTVPSGYKEKSKVQTEGGIQERSSLKKLGAERGPGGLWWVMEVDERGKD